MTNDTDTKAGFCSNCRAGSHALCASPTCSCPDARRHRGRPDYAKVPTNQRRPANHNGNRSEIRGGGLASSPAKAKPTKPVFELVRADPPAPRSSKTTLVERARPLLEQLMAADERDWHRLAVLPSTAGAGHARARMAKAYGAKEWEFVAARLDEVDQSALYVRWLGVKGRQL